MIIQSYELQGVPERSDNLILDKTIVKNIL
jgi:hypothetical protein